VVVLFQDETIVRLFPVLRRSWSLSGEQAKVGISGRNAQLVVSCALNPKSGNRITFQHKGMNTLGFQALLRKVRRAYGRRPVCMLLDQGNLHTAKASLRLAEKLNITLLWIPKQHAELNCVDQLWRSVKADVSANYQYQTIQQHAQAVEEYVHSLTKKQTLAKAGVLSKQFWLKEKM
jgi:hypothetical protein